MDRLQAGAGTPGAALRVPSESVWCEQSVPAARAGSKLRLVVATADGEKCKRVRSRESGLERPDRIVSGAVAAASSPRAIPKREGINAVVQVAAHRVPARRGSPLTH
jgi:hypothetical protein